MTRVRAGMFFDSETGEWKDSSGEPVSEFGADSSTAPVIENSAEAIMEEHADPEWEKREKKRREIQKVFQTAMINSRQRKIAQDKMIQKILSKGLGRNVNIHGGIIGIAPSTGDELISMSVTPEKYAKAVISDYSHEIKSEMKKAEKMAEKADRNRDGIVTEAEKQETIDEYMPGMKTLSKYM